MRIALAIAAFVLAGCSRDPLSRTDDGGASDDLGSRVAASCAGLAEPDCRARPDCVADQCMECSCAPVFVGCRDDNAAPTPCPGLGCAQPNCCRSRADCPIGQPDSCVAPGEQLCGGPAIMLVACLTDADCAAQPSPPQVCDAPPCERQVYPLACLRGCLQDGDCAEGELCTGDHHCRPRSCASDGDCPPGFGCSSSGADLACARRTCSVDGDCPSSTFCVNGGCYESLGACGPTPV